MGDRLRVIAVILGFLCCLSGKAELWTTHLAYNNVTQIAMASDVVYAISDGSLFSVDKQNEAIKVYNRQSGLHETTIACIYYDAIGEQLIIAYGNGKIDLLSSRGVQYIGELYEKDMTQRKTIYNVTIAGRTAYLSTHYGVQTMDLRENKLVDSYWLRPGGQETPIKDVLIANDSIYAFSDDSLYCASLTAPLSDYTYWHREILGRIPRDTEKGVHYQEGTSEWYAGGAEGIVRYTATQRLTYKPQGPLVNSPYRMTAKGGIVYVVPGGRWASQDEMPGYVMYYDGQNWRNISSAAIEAVTNRIALDFVNVAIDPRNNRHYYVTSYGTGLYEFIGDSLVKADIAGGDNTLISAVASAPATYTRLDCAVCDSAGNVWLMDAGTENQLQCEETDGTWHGLTVTANNQNLAFYTPGGLVIDRLRANHKWMCTARYNTFLCVMDDQGTPFDTSDDRTMVRDEWKTQDDQIFHPDNILDLIQDQSGRLWMATDKGVAYIDVNTDFFTSDAIVRPVLANDDDLNPISSQQIQAIGQTPDGRVWLGSLYSGVYVLDANASQVVAHYTTDNSAMPSNSILSLICDEQGIVWIGTAEGLAELDPHGVPEGLNPSEDEETRQWNEGDMLQWKLHFSYTNPQEVVETPQAVFTIADGSLFSVNKKTDEITCWNKSTGLHGSSIAHIAYDKQSERLIIAYENGQIDLLDKRGNAYLMPDISMKAGSMTLTINHICVGSRAVYLAMSFGIIAINPKKGEVIDTYYIGNEAADINVQQIVECKDSLYAFSYDRVHVASLNSNVVDYHVWRSEALPCEQVHQAAAFKDEVYAMYDQKLHRRIGGAWQTVAPDTLLWFHPGDEHLLAEVYAKGLFVMNDNDQLDVITGAYGANDAIYTGGQYWLGVPDYGLVRISSNGVDHFRPEGPLSNFGYSLHVAHNQVYVAPGGRWAAEFSRQIGLSIYNGQQWIGIPWGDTYVRSGYHDMRDPVSYAVDLTDPSHFFVATYGTGLFEYRNYQAVNHYNGSNSTLREADTGIDVNYYTRTDGAMTDEQGNLWVLNPTSIGQPVHVRTLNGQWRGLTLYSNGEYVSLITPAALRMDLRDSRYKWFLDQRYTPGVFFLYDNGTPSVSGDDHCLKRSSFVDQNNNTITPTFFYSLAQDKKNRLWIGTEKGILLIPAEVDFFTSNACKRIIIPRNDGTGLGDYLLGDEQINSMAVDDGNRMWIGTQTSGLYLIEDDTITVAHFTENNSLLPSNTIQSIAIVPSTGEVFVGTDKGIASYRSDASEAKEDMKSAYAYPNPVRPDYGGYVSITNLMDDSEVRIVDAGGNLVCKTRSHGGTAVWDLKDAYGRRATPGIYTALCNAQGGNTAVKIMVIR